MVAGLPDLAQYIMANMLACIVLACVLPFVVAVLGILACDSMKGER